MKKRKIFKLCEMCGSKFELRTQKKYCSDQCKNRRNYKRKLYKKYLIERALAIAEGAPRPECDLFYQDIEKIAAKHGIVLPETQPEAVAIA